jgi:hypothetical protein
MAVMNLVIESREDFLVATASGKVSLRETVELSKNVCDAAAERGFSKILFDCRAVEGELSVTERYIFGSTIAEYCRSRSMSPSIAVIRRELVVTGLAAQVASNRGASVLTFSELQAGLNWLHGRGSKATAS